MILFDIETNGLLDPKRNKDGSITPPLSKVHCLVTLDTATGQTRRFRGDDIATHGLTYLASAPAIGGHNIIKFDLPALEKVFGWKYNGDIYDTLVVSRLAFADIKDNDHKQFKKGVLPGGLIGSHSLKAWGYRLGCLKGTYAEDTEDCWAEWSAEMEDYCEQDVQVTFKLWKVLQKKSLSPLSVWLEHEFCKVIARQERRGVAFDIDAAEALLVDLLDQREQAGRKLKEIFGSWQVELKPLIPKRDNKKRGYKAGVPVRKFKTVEFNPASRDHIANRLIHLHGWKPTEFTDGGKPKVDEKIISKLKYPEVPMILDYLLLDKRLGQLSEGDNAWLKLARECGRTKQGRRIARIHGSVNTGGAVTGRCTHAYPNLAQVPKVGSRFGKECRSLFIPSDGMTLVGCDASGLEARCLAHYMARWDKGEYVKVILEGDIHTVNQLAAGLPTRDSAKPFFYGFLYGAGDEKLGSIVGGSIQEGKKLRAKFLRGLPALRSLIDTVKATARERGYLRGLDGRKLHVWSLHAALNTLLQSAGALVMKLALVIADWLLQAEGLVPGLDYEFVLNIHDEFQAEVVPHLAEKVGECLASAIHAAGQFFNFRCPLAGEYKVGANWAETH
ncbi:MAG: DNA polymerase [Planctomycetaceae bacterium]|nr:DNA polymerase [Planctomycetaceae bacterium]